MLTRMFLVFAAGLPALAKDYQNFDLPRSRRQPISEPSLSYVTPKVSLRGKSVRLKTPGFDHKDYLFAREAFLTEKRDEAIKLLRQELDSGMTANRDNLLLRLGQLYAEKYMELSYRENELHTEALAAHEKRKATEKGLKPPVIDNSRSKSYLNDSLSLFYSLERDYPRHPKLDEVLFFIGFVEMESGKPEKGSQYLERVVRRYPRSRKFEDAVVYLADHYFDKAKFRDAYAKYRILLNRPKSPVYHYAKYKLAWCELNTNEQRKGLGRLKALVTELSGTEDKAKFNLREQALKDLVIFFAEVESVEEAIAYFTDTQGKDKALENLKLIADILRSKAKDEPAVRAYRRLLEEFPDAPEAPLMALGIYESLSRLGRQEQAVVTLEKALERYGQESEWAKKFSKDKEGELQKTLNTLQAEAERAALTIHQSAQKSANKSSYAHALRLYTAILKAFANHPSRKNIAFYRGEILFEQAKWLEAANSYMEAAKIPPKDKRTDEAVYSALEALDRLTEHDNKIARYDENASKAVSLEKAEIPEGEKRFIEVAGFYLKEYPQGARIIDVKFRMAAIYYKFRHLDEAKAQFKDIAVSHPKHRSSTTAAHIVLDIYNMRKDYDGLAAAASEFVRVEGLGDAAFRAEMAQILAEVNFKRIERLETENKWKEAGDAYLSVYKANSQGSLAEKSLYNAYISYEKADEVALAADTSKLFLAKYPKSPYAQKLTLGLAKSAERQYEIEQAQKLYLSFARQFPKDKESRKALYNAALFSEILERNAEALRLWEEYLRGPVTAEERKAIQISQAKLYRKMGELEKMASIYRNLARNARSFDEKMAFLGELARQYELKGRNGEREQLLKEMRWQHSAAQGAKVTGIGAYYLAEAEFRAVAPKRDKYHEIPLRFPPEDLVYLLKRKEKALLRIGEAYDKVVEIGVPDWGVAALFEKADAYGRFAKAFRAVQIPKGYKGEVRTEAEKSLRAIDDKLIKLLEAKAQEIFKACADRAAQFRVVSEYAARCRRDLKAAESYADPAGLMPQPSYWSTRPPSAEVASK